MDKRERRRAGRWLAGAETGRSLATNPKWLQRSEMAPRLTSFADLADAALEDKPVERLQDVCHVRRVVVGVLQVSRFDVPQERHLRTHSRSVKQVSQQHSEPVSQQSVRQSDPSALRPCVRQQCVTSAPCWPNSGAGTSAGRRGQACRGGLCEQASWSAADDHGTQVPRGTCQEHHVRCCTRCWVGLRVASRAPWLLDYHGTQETRGGWQGQSRRMSVRGGGGGGPV